MNSSANNMERSSQENDNLEEEEKSSDIAVDLSNFM